MNIRVANLPLQFTEQDLKNLFAEYGEVREIKFLLEAQVEVNLEHQETENSVIEKLHGKEFNGNKLLVCADEENDRGLRPTSHGSGGQQPKPR
ncbi:hypothetical protein [Scytonema sp. NUACC26]|uniref:hypothetical protein n=1 Tax=Scytonema sp. NUACC26 TaxID=3140176 RepID=UPI0034DC4CD3